MPEFNLKHESMNTITGAETSFGTVKQRKSMRFQALQFHM